MNGSSQKSNAKANVRNGFQHPCVMRTPTNGGGHNG
jgi:hypothetical protein